MKRYSVTAKHVSPRYTFVGEIVEAKEAPGHDGYWYAKGSLGCSKDYSSPERAVRSLFEDNACTAITVTEI